MLLESLRGLGDAGDCGASGSVVGGDTLSESSPFTELIETGLSGLMGVFEFEFSFPVFGRMASDSVDDFGIFRKGLFKGSQDC